MSDPHMRCTLYLCSECEQVSSDDAWSDARWKERSRRIGQVNRGEVNPAEEGWYDPTDPKAHFMSSYGLDDRMVCPRCGYIHSDDECSYVEEIEGVACRS